MILAARDRGNLAEVLVIAAALSTQDRGTPPERQAAADQAHAASGPGARANPSSCGTGTSGRPGRKSSATNIEQAEGLVQANFLSWLRLREWRDVFTQLHPVCAEHGWKENDKPASYEAIHKALLTGLLGHVGCKIEDASGPAAGSYLGARGIKFWPHPGSAIAKKAGKWIMVPSWWTPRACSGAAARIEPEWLEEVGGHLLKRQVSEPHWSEGQRRGPGLGRAPVRPHGVSGRGVSYREIDPACAASCSSARAWCRARSRRGPAAWPSWPTTGAWWPRSSASSTSPAAPTCWVDEELIHAFYDAKLPPEVLTSPPASRPGARTRRKRRPRCCSSPATS